MTEKLDARLTDKNWRLSHLYKIKNKQNQLVTFKLNRAQADFEKNKHTRNIILKSRQLGFTTLEEVDCLDDVLFRPNFDSLFIAQDLETAGDIFNNKITLAWENFLLKPMYEVDRSNARRLKFCFLEKGPTGVFVPPVEKQYSSITVDSSGRSGTYHRMHITEFGRLCKLRPDKAKEILEGSIPAVPTNGRIDIESTADGSDGKFYELFWEAWERDRVPLQTEFKAHFYNWQWDEEIQTLKPYTDLPTDFIAYQRVHKLSEKEITYYYLKWLSLSKDWVALRKEYPTTPHEAFQSSGNKMFDQDRLNLIDPHEGDKEGDWMIWERPELRRRYAIGADIAEGVGKDACAAVIWDFTDIRPKIVGRYINNKIAPDMFAYELKNKAEKYNMAMVAPERNNHGHATIQKLKEIYPERHIYRDQKDRLGWDTNLITKPKMFYDFNTAFNDDLIEFYDKVLVSEMRRYEREELNNVRFNDEVTQHFDLLTAAVIGFQMKSALPTARGEAVVWYPK